MSLTEADIKAITDATIAYCWALDEKRWDDLDNLFTGTSTFDAGAGTTHEGVDAIKTYVSGVLAQLDVSQHLLGNHQVTETAEGAASRAYFHAQHIRSGMDGGSKYIVAGIYNDTWQRSATGWRISHRRLKVLWTEGNADVLDV